MWSKAILVFLFSGYPVRRRLRGFSIIMASADLGLAEKDARWPVKPRCTGESLSFPGVTQNFGISAMDLDYSFETISSQRFHNTFPPSRKYVALVEQVIPRNRIMRSSASLCGGSLSLTIFP